MWIPAFGGAVLLWAALPPLNLWPLAWIAPIPWVLLIRRGELGGRRPYRVLTVAGFAFWMAALHWLRLPHWATSFGWIALSFYFAFYLPVFVGLSRVAVHRLHVPVILAAPVVWTGLELAQAHLLTGMSMGNLCHTQYRQIWLIQVSDLAGAYGVSFVVMFTAAALARMLPCDGRRWAIWPLAPAATMIAATLSYGYLRTAGVDTLPGPRIALIQGSIDVELEPAPDFSDRILKEYFDLSRTAVQSDAKIDLVVWPESMFPSPLMEFAADARQPPEYPGDEAEFHKLVEQYRELSESHMAPPLMASVAQSLHVPMVVGVNRKYVGPDGVRGFGSAANVARDGHLLGCYDKIHLVMFGEYVPLAGYFPWLQQLTPLPESAMPGERPVAFDLKGIRLAPNICYESVLSHVIRGQVNTLAAEGNEPDVLLNVTNDGWFWGSSELDMHLACGVFRAVECRKPFLIAANTGFSAWIDGDGRILEQGPRRDRGVVIADVRLDRRRSWYLEHGDWFAGTCLAICVLLAGVGLLSLRKTAECAGRRNLTHFSSRRATAGDWLTFRPFSSSPLGTPEGRKVCLSPWSPCRGLPAKMGILAAIVGIGSRQWGVLYLCTSSNGVFEFAGSGSFRSLEKSHGIRTETMCGIVGYIGPREAAEFLLAGLHRLEYRGYDSAGVATITPEGQFALVKTVGRIERLDALLAENPAPGRIGIGHTRWATHGAPSDVNSHPHLGGNGALALVHNGVIENFQPLKQRLQTEGYTFLSATDSEVVAHLIDSCLRRQPAVADMAAVDYQPLVSAVQAALAQLQGTYGLAIIFRQWPEVMIAARLGSPLVVGVGAGEHFVASDASPLAGYTDQIVYLADHELAVVTAKNLRVIHRDQGFVSHSVHVLDFQSGDIAKGGFEHFMLKEIFEQPEAIGNALRGRLDRDAATAKFGGFNLTPQQLRAVSRIIMTACGTSWHAGLVGEYQIEALARLPVEVEYASELRYRNPPLDNNTLVFAITQSGETADTLAALREMKRKGCPTLGICNVVGSTIAQESDGGFYLCRTGDRRGFDQSLHFAMHAAGDAGPLFRPPPPHELLDRHADDRPIARAPREGRAVAAMQRARPGNRRQVRPLQQFPLSRPAVQFSYGPGRRAEAEGDQLHPRRGLPGRRDETWSDRLGRSVYAQRVLNAAKPCLRQGDVEPSGDQGARRAGDRRRRPGRQRGVAAGRRNDRDSRGRGLLAADRERHSAATVGLPHRGGSRLRRRQAPQPGEERDGGVVTRASLPAGGS